MNLRIPAQSWPQIIRLVEVAKLAIRNKKKTEAEAINWLEKQWLEISPPTKPNVNPD